MKPNLQSKQAKYILGIRKGKTKKKAALDAGYSYNTAVQNTDKIEKSLTFQRLEKALSYKDELLKKTTLEQIAQEQLKVVFQDENLNAKNTAIAQVVETLEPKGDTTDYEERVLIVLK